MDAAHPTNPRTVYFLGVLFLFQHVQGLRTRPGLFIAYRLSCFQSVRTVAGPCGSTGVVSPLGANDGDEEGFAWEWTYSVK